ncbi:sulfate ABC transporter permease subunit CysT [Chlorobium sp. BLA1]|uniref:sulfate ABC transporter permease subunit CysT n=1 Tax=Candidatus Chlorobium masyuteum TaxID=2716876 RepID=UPI00141DB5B1|nr:sulfate ABC transporter permease subunit CysT [Candidatus Chlorobium masyuteum]NHQ60753.1 sulfate ABC transporter permease subunit CysT [Candidatus Chlorobium masyuteum]NTU45388.1 sulfate ABC transporter permease subunit CysT [Chlorobiaceae bacterium]
MGIFQKKRRNILPGFGLSMGYTVFYLSAVVIVPLSMIFFNAIPMGWEPFVSAVTAPRVLASYKLSFSTAFFAALFDAVAGLLTAWVLVRYRFPGKAVLDALVDIPFALPTAVAGICFATLYSPVGWLGDITAKWNIEVINSPTGIVIALIFIGFPFVVRTLQPVLEELEPEIEESAHCLGATRMQTFRKILLPHLFPALLTGSTLAFARGIGEYGSVIFIAGNLPMKTEIAPLMIMSKLDQYDYNGASAVALVLLVISFSMILLLNAVQEWQQKEYR